MIGSTSLGLLLAACAAVAQTVGGPLSFEVASIKPSAPIASKEGKERVGLSVAGTRVTINFTSLSDLVRIAYRVKPYQIAGPDRITSERFDVVAKMPDGANPDQMPEMLQTLLSERFKLTLHRETRELPIYALLVGKNGLKLPEAEPGADAGGDSKTKTGGAMLINRKMTLGDFAIFVGRMVDRPVVDLTGLTGTYQVAMEIPIEDLIKAKVAAEGRAGSGADHDPAASPMFTAVQKFGLKLEPRKAPTEVLVIERAERLPTAN